jgi:heme/copper-type cytochrome/quinol oxidase subunit 3
VARPRLDVYHLPSSALDAQHPIWWGNTLLLCVETTLVSWLVVAYFYLRHNFEPWPPPRVNQGLPMLPSAPGLEFATANTVLLLLSVVPMIAVDRIARRRARAEVATEERPEPIIPPHGGFLPHTMSTPVVIFLALTLLGGVSTYLRFHEFGDLRFNWHDNAYASVIWSLLGLHLSYIVMSVIEVFLLAVWVWQEGFTVKFALDTTLAAVSWYWTVGVWLVIYAVVFWAPRWLGS